MSGKLKIDVKRVMKYSWIATNVSLLQLGLGSYVLYSDYFFTNNDALLYLTLLSFPISIPTLFFTVSFIDVYQPMDYLCICLVAFVSGYFQWFWFLPRLAKEREILSLQLSSHNTGTVSIVATDSISGIRQRKSEVLKPAPKIHFDKRAIHLLNAL